MRVSDGQDDRIGVRMGATVGFVGQRGEGS